MIAMRSFLVKSCTAICAAVGLGRLHSVGYVFFELLVISVAAPPKLLCSGYIRKLRAQSFDRLSIKVR